jgi:hypothetical protein
MHQRLSRTLSVLAASAVALSGLVAVGSPAMALAAPGQQTTASALLEELAVAPDVGTGYDRAAFRHWIDADGDGCDTREEVLISESDVPVTTGAGCTVVAGQWTSWYDGAVWTNPADVDIDHFVPLEEAWSSGASAWSADQRMAYANDLDFSPALVAVTDNVNSSKGSADPAHWLPPLPEVRCEYATDWVEVKYRWNLAVDNAERSALADLLTGNCGSAAIVAPAKAGTAETQPQQPAPVTNLYKIAYDQTIFELITNADGSQMAVPLTYAKWRDVYHFAPPLPASTDFVKYPWSPTLYAVTFWPGGEDAWLWTPLSYAQWQTAGYPAARNAGWIKGSYYYRWGSAAEIFVLGQDGVNHKLTGAEWAASGYRNFDDRSNEGLLKLSWAPEIAWMTDLSSGAGRPMAYPEWQKEAFPTPRVVQRITGDQFYQNYGDARIWYAGPGMNRTVSYNEWAGAGFPTPDMHGHPPVVNPPAPPVQNPPAPPGPQQPGNPGDVKNCSDFRTQAEAQAWFNTYFPWYGDVARLDNDGDGIACETLP